MIHELTLTWPDFFVYDLAQSQDNWSRWQIKQVLVLRVLISLNSYDFLTWTKNSTQSQASNTDHQDHFFLVLSRPIDTANKNDGDNKIQEKVLPFKIFSIIKISLISRIIQSKSWFTLIMHTQFWFLSFLYFRLLTSFLRSRDTSLGTICLTISNGGKKVIST